MSSLTQNKADIFRKAGFISELYKIALLKYGKRVTEPQDPIEDLKEYVTDSPPYNYIHFSKSAEFWGVNIKTEWNTPLGIYTYPLTTGRLNRIIEKNIEFAGNYKYIHIYKVNTSNILYTESYTKSDLDKDIQKLKTFNSSDLIDEYVSEMEERCRVNIPAGHLFYLVFKLSGGGDPGFDESQNKSKARAIFVRLGYDVIHDSGKGIIHSNEPTQAVFFASKFLKVLDVIENPVPKRKKDEFTYEGAAEATRKEQLELIKKIIKAIENNNITDYNASIIMLNLQAVPAKRFNYFIDKVSSILHKKAERIKRLKKARDYYKEKLQKINKFPPEELVKYIDQNKINKMIKQRKNIERIIYKEQEFLNPFMKLLIENIKLDHYKYFSKETYFHALVIPIEYINKAISTLKNYKLGTMLHHIAQNHKFSDGLDATPLLDSDNELNRQAAIKYVPENLLVKLINDDNNVIRENVAKRVDKKYLPLMINDPSIAVKVAVLKRIDKKYHSHNNFMYSPYDEIRFTLAGLTNDNDILSKMINDRDQRIRYAVALKIDKGLVHHFARDSQASIRTVAAKRMPVDKLSLMYNDKEEIIIYTIFDRISSNPDDLIDIVNNKKYSILMRTVASIKVTTNLLVSDEQLYKIMNSDIEEVRQRVAQGISATDGLLKMINDPSHIVRRIISKRLPQQHIHKMIGDDDDVVMRNVVSQTDEKHLPKMITDARPTIRTAVARKIDKSYLPKMMNDSDNGVRLIVAHRVDPDKVVAMYDDDHYFIRKIVAEKAPPSFLTKMIKDEDSTVRRSVAKRIPKEFVYRMLNDSDIRVVESAASRVPDNHLFNLPITENMHWRITIEIIERKAKTEPKYLLKFIKHERDIVRENVAKFIHKEYLPFMLNDSAYRVRYFAVKRIDEEYLYEMMSDDHDRVRSAVARRIPKIWLPAMMNDDSYFVRADVAENIPEEYLKQMYRLEEERDDSDYDVRSILEQRMEEEA
jgi:hypothetical protein